MKHTPGPWEIRFSKSGYPYKIKAPEQSPKRAGGLVDITRWGSISMPASEEGQANARLIAAAPDLLTAIKRLLPKTFTGSPSRADEVAHWERERELGNRHARFVLAAYKAIAKAEGK